MNRDDRIVTENFENDCTRSRATPKARINEFKGKTQLVYECIFFLSVLKALPIYLCNVLRPVASIHAWVNRSTTLIIYYIP